MALTGYRSLTILKTGSTFDELALREGDFEDWVHRGIGEGAGPVRFVDAKEAADLPAPSTCTGVVITGSPHMLTEPSPWRDRAVRWVRDLVLTEIPILGICYGHQLLAVSLGGEVDWHPEGREMGTHPVRLTSAGCSDPLLGSLGPTFLAHSSHAQSVRRLPPGAIRLASSGFEANHAFRYDSFAWGVQFHPEFSESAMKAYLDRYRDRLAEQGLDADRLIDEVRPSPAVALLERFAELCVPSAITA